MSDSSSAGGLINRLAARAERAELSRVAVPGGGAALSGPLASRALKAVGARAMTLDRSIIVSEDFDPSNPEDQALFAHEQYHAQHGDGGGGGGGENFRDAEEIAARAAEAMVFHRAGGYEGGYTPGGGPGGGTNSGPQDHSGQGVGAGVASSTEKNETIDSDPDPDRGYKSLMAQGYSHQDVVDDLARKAMNAIDDRRRTGHDRNSDLRGSFSGAGGVK